MRIAGMTPEEWARDVHTVILLSENPVAILTALVERIHVETTLEVTAKFRRRVEPVEIQPTGAVN